MAYFQGKYPFAMPLYEGDDQLTQSKVYFDFETTGLGWAAHIVQIAAVSDFAAFTRYVIPKKPIDPGASKVNGFSFREGSLYLRNVKLHAVPLKEALGDFLQFLQAEPTAPLLIGHNIKNFDCHLLSYAADACGVNLDPLITGFFDTLPYFRAALKGKVRSFKQVELYRHFFGNTYEAHDAVADVTTLKRIVECYTRGQPAETQPWWPHTFSLAYIQETNALELKQNQH